MKKLTLALLLALICSFGFSQKQEVFRIDSLPKQGILLDKGWKWHAGDNPDFAKADFDDSKWENIDPTIDIFDLPQVSKQGAIFWLRLPLLLSDSASKESLIMTIRQSGASELFLNGKLLERIGVLSKDKSQIKAFSPGRDPFSLQIQPNHPQILAVRYAFQPNIFYATHFANTNTILSIEITSLKTWYKKENKAQFGIKWDIIVGGIFTTLFILFFAFYLFFPEQKINLYFTVYTALQVLPYGIFSGFYTVKHVEIYYWIGNALITMSVVASSFLLLAVYRLFNQKIGIIFLLVISLGISCIPMAMLVYDWGWVVYGVLFNFLFNLELLRIAIVGVLKNKKGAWFIASGGFFFCLSWFLFLSSGSANSSFEFAAPYFYALAQISIPLSVALHLGYNFAQTNLSLQQKLTEIEILSNEKQQILASQNETLERQVAERTAELKASQNQLIQKEKLASLGELTAGIAHEIQNPLNFVNNFSELSTELLDELSEELPEELKTPPSGVGGLLADITQNLEKINYHGKRASSIIKGMLEHSRQSTGERTLTDINQLADEYLRLSYHGIRAKDSNFNSDYKTDFDENLPKIEVIPQDIGRVILNLINNAFWAVKTVEKPLVMVKTEHTGNQVIIKVIDNGTGISEDVKAKIFQPFFTTKPTGEGTGLGLSLAYDIVTKGHGGTLEVVSKEGKGSEFIIQLPIKTS